MGFGAALLFGRFMGAGDSAPAVLTVSALILALRALGGNGTVRNILRAILPQRTAGARSLLSGWALGLALAGFVDGLTLILGLVCLIAGVLCSILFRGGREAVRA